MISEQEAREAAGRLLTKQPYVGDVEDSFLVAEFATQELSRRDAERAERDELDKPITAEWLKSMGFRAGHDLAWHTDRVAVRQYAQSMDDNTTSTILLDDSEIVWSATRRQLKSLIEALRGGA